MPEQEPRWVPLDVMAAAFGVSENRARRIARLEQVRTIRWPLPPLYHWGDVVAVARRRKKTGAHR